VSKFVKSVFKTPKTPNDETNLPSSVAVKSQATLPISQVRPSGTVIVPKPATTDVPQMAHTDSSHEILQNKSLSATIQSSTSLPLTSKDEMNSLAETASSPVPPVLARTGKAAIGTRVLPVLDINGDTPPVRLRHLTPSEKKGTTM
jgi:hypothetical protein